MIPDIALYKIVQSCIDGVRADYNSRADKTQTILHYILSSIPEIGKFNWYEQGVEVFIGRDENHTKYLDTRLFFDRERAPVPTVHIMVNGERKGEDGIGIDLGFAKPVDVDDSQRDVLNRQFSIDANIVITSDNTFETVIIYHVLKSMLVSLMTHIQLVGFINPVLSGRDIQISQELVPNGIYTRVLSFSAGYELSSPKVFVDRVANSVWFQIRSINEQDVSPYPGVGPISTGGDYESEKDEIV